MDNTTTIALKGRIDSSNADSVFEEVCKEIDSECKALIIDVETLEYISSAGLRQLMKLKKSYPELTMINANDEVYDIMEVTGFSSIMTVQKAYKQYSVDGCKMIGKGAKGEVYRYDDELIIKVYNDRNSLDDINEELTNSREVFILGVPTAIPFGIGKVKDDYAALFELIKADSVANMLSESPDKYCETAKLMAELAKEMHGIQVDKDLFAKAEDYAYEWIKGGIARKDEALGKKCNEMIAGLKPCRSFVHGDFHGNNVMMQGDEPVLIDMDRIAIGNPIIDLSGMFMFYVGWGELDKSKIENFMRTDYETTKKFYYEFIRLYFNEASEVELKAKEDKIEIVAYSRLMRSVYKKGDDMDAKDFAAVDYYYDKIKERLARVDSLDLF